MVLGMKISVVACIVALLISTMTGAVLVNLVNANGIPVTVPWPYVKPPSNPPTISIKHPANATYGGTSIILDLAITIPAEANTQIGSVVYSLDGSKNVSCAGRGTWGQASTHFTRTLTGLSEGKHSIVVYVSCERYETYTNQWIVYFGGGKQAVGSGTAYSRAVWGCSDEICFVMNAVPLRVTVLSLENETYKNGEAPLDFTVSEAVAWMGYSLDEQPTATITGNTTLTGLPAGTHKVIVYANDTAGNQGRSKLVQFSIAGETGSETSPPESIPTDLVAAASVSVAAIFGTGLAVRFRRKRRGN
jgi:hypothetical protein